MIWMNSSAPAGWFKLQGGSFDVSRYPQLHSIAGIKTTLQRRHVMFQAGVAIIPVNMATTSIKAWAASRNIKRPSPAVALLAQAAALITAKIKLLTKRVVQTLLAHVKVKFPLIVAGTV